MLHTVAINSDVTTITIATGVVSVATGLLDIVGMQLDSNLLSLKGGSFSGAQSHWTTCWQAGSSRVSPLYHA